MIRAAVLAVVVSLAAAAAQAAEPVKVMILGTFHMSNPGRDIHNAKIEDVLAPKHQADLGQVGAGRVEALDAALED